MSKRKSKLKWRLYSGEIENRYVDPWNFKRLHAPLKNILTWQAEFQGFCVTLRPCAEGVDNSGTIKAVLYCTKNNNRFFEQDKDGFWNEHVINYTPNKPSLKNRKSHSEYPRMAHHRGLCCHLLIAHAWLGARPKGKVCDHLDTNLLNISADNLQWVSIPENNRRRKIARQLRKAGLDPKRLTPTLCRGIYTLPDERIDEFLERFKMCCVADDGDLSVENIRINVANALDAMK